MVRGKSSAVADTTNDGGWLNVILPVLVLLPLGAIAVLHPHALESLNSHRLAVTLDRIGPWGPALYIATIAVSVVVSQIPGAPLAIAAGAVWDPLLAGIYTVIGGFGGALIAYSLGKNMGRSIVRALTGKTFSFSTERGESYVGWMIFTTRLLPIFSFDLMSYGAGMTGLSLPIYASATLFGMVPSTLLLTYMGDGFHLGGQAAIALAGLFATAAVGIPALLYRFNWLDVRELIRWE
ncbi:MAG: TVP38/TMEM64 family protein [Synechococcus sp.]